MSNDSPHPSHPSRSHRPNSRPSSPEGWIPVGIVFDGDAIDVDGVNPWTVSWNSTGETAQVRHPAYPTQVHDVPVYEMTFEGRTIRFATGELSNTVWGFYLPFDLPRATRTAPSQGNPLSQK